MCELSILTSFAPHCGFFLGTGILVPELIPWKISDTSGEGLPTCRTWLNRESRGVRPQLRFQLEFTSSRCLTPVSWMTREWEAPSPGSGQANWVAGWGGILPRLQTRWRETKDWDQLGENGALTEEPASPRLQAGPDRQVKWQGEGSWSFG